MESGNNNGGNNGGWNMWGGGGGGWNMGCMGMKMNYYNEPTWDAEIEHLRKYVKQRFAWIDQQLSFSEPSTPIATEALIIDDWGYYDKDDGDNPPPVGFQPHLSITRLNFYTLTSNTLTVQSVDGGLFRLVALDGKTLFKKQIPAGTQSFQIPRAARNQQWIATLNGKMLSR